jgi:peptidoglycan-associated lipoprotein
MTTLTQLTNDKHNYEGIMKLRTTVFTFAAIGLMTLAGCATTSDTTDEADSGSSDTGSEFDQGETPKTDVVSDRTGSMELGTAYFDFNRAEIRGDMRDVLKANAEVLQRSDGTAVIAGHADERGSEEYNLALGERRAEAVRKYLSALGVSSSQMRVVSYGEAKPASTGHDESAWQLNRRAEFSMR